MSCSFCHITENNIRHIKLNKEQIVENVLSSIVKQSELTPEIKNKYIKLCWMGSGDPYNEKNKRNFK